jgi:hypothetical protein
VYERYLGILFTLSFCHRVFSCSNDILNLKLRLLVFWCFKIKFVLFVVFVFSVVIVLCYIA